MMSRDTFVLIAFCVFALLVGMRIKQRIADRIGKKDDGGGHKNRRPEAEDTGEPSLVREKRLRRERRVRFFTIAQLFVLGGLMIYMIPALVKDFMMPGRVDAANIFLRCLIFVFTIYIFILGYIKVFGRKDKENTEK